MAIPKRNKRLSALASRTVGASGAVEKPDLPELGGKVPTIFNAIGKVFGTNTQSLATDEGVIPLPDEDELARVRRRRAARRGGGRASTVLSDENSLGG